MGNSVSAPFTKNSEVTVMICGLDNSGKSSIVSYLQPTDISKEVIYIIQDTFLSALQNKLMQYKTAYSKCCHTQGVLIN